VPDELGAEGQTLYFGSLPPARVARRLAAVKLLDLRWLAEQLDPDNTDQVKVELGKWLAAFADAVSGSMGIVAWYG
jgi:hypothetical protein